MKIKRPLELIVSAVAILTLVLLFNSFTGAAPANSSSTIGYVDMDKLQDQLPEFQRLQSFVKDKESEYKLFQNYVLTQHQNVLKGLKEKADQEKNGKSADEQAAIEKRFNDEVQKKTEETKNQLEQKRNEFMQAINDQKKVVEAKVRKLISSVAEEKKLSVALEKNAVLYGGTDITDLVIEKGKKEAETEKSKSK